VRTVRLTESWVHPTKVWIPFRHILGCSVVAAARPSPSAGEAQTEVAAQVALRFLHDRPGWRSATGYFADQGPLEDRIDPLAVRTAGFGSDIEVQLVFEHRSFPGRLFGLRSGPVWTEERQRGSRFTVRPDPEAIGIAFGNWAEDFPCVYGLEVNAMP